MRTALSVIACGLICSSTLLAQKAKPDPVPVFVTSIGAANGVTDPNQDNRDSVKDLSGWLKKQKGVRLVTTASESQIVVTVVGRERGAKMATGTEHILRAELKVGDRVTPMTVERTGGWEYPAIAMAKQIGEWVRANQHTLAAQQ